MQSLSIQWLAILGAAAAWTTFFSLFSTPGIRGYRNLGLLAPFEPHTTADFWDCYGRLPECGPETPFIAFKRVGRHWSVRVGLGHHALAADAPDGLVWFWIDPHNEYERLLANP